MFIPMIQRLLLGLLAVCLLPFARAYSGDATFYFQNGVAGACGAVNSDYVSIVALHISLYGYGQYCGRTIVLTNTATGQSATAVVADACPTCSGFGSIDLSYSLFTSLASEVDGVFPASETRWLDFCFPSSTLKPSFNLLIGSSYRESQANLSPKEATAPGDAAYAEGLYRKLGYVEAVLLRDLLTTAQCLLPTTTDMIILSPDDHPLTAHSISDFRNSTIAETLMTDAWRSSQSSQQSQSEWDLHSVTVKPPPYSTAFQNQDTLPITTVPRRISSLPGSLNIPEKTFNYTSTNYLYLKTRNDPIQGSYHVDPTLSAVKLNTERGMTVDRRQFMRKHRQRHRLHKPGTFQKPSSSLDPNLIFGSKYGAIDVDLFVVSKTLNSPEAQRTLIQVATKMGDIDIRVRHIAPNRRLNLEVSSRSGDVVVLLPRNFSGYIQAYHPSSRTLFLPSISGCMNLVSRWDQDVQVVVGDARYQTPMEGVEWDGDTVYVAARDGVIYIGYVDEDSKPPPPPGFWNRVAGMLRKSNSNLRVSS